jgi:hypothetical protein
LVLSQHSHSTSNQASITSLLGEISDGDLGDIDLAPMDVEEDSSPLDRE